MQTSFHRLWAVSAAVVAVGLVVGCDNNLSTKADSATTTTTSKSDEVTSTTSASDKTDSTDTTSESNTDTTDTTSGDSTDTTSATDSGDEAATGFREFPTPTIDLTEAGTDPELRTFEFRVGDTTTQIEESEMHMEQSVDGGSVTIDYTATGRTKNTVVAVDGDIATIRQVFEAMKFTVADTVPAQVAASMEPIGDAMTGLTVDVEVDSRGNILSATPDPSTLPDSETMISQVLNTVMNSLGSGAQPWPDQPVGVGAYWTQRTDSTNSGVRTLVTSELKLVSIESGVAHLESTSTIKQERAAGSMMDVDGTGNGTIKRSVKLGSYLGQTVHSEASSDAKMTSQLGDQRLVMEIVSDSTPEG